MKFLLFIVIILSLIPEIADSEEIVIASEHSEYTPFMWKERGEIVGAGAELTSNIFKEIGIKVNCKYVGKFNSFRISMAGRYDI